MHERVKKLIENNKLQEIKEKFAGKKVLLCGEGRNGKCDENCADLLLKDKCGYHQRTEIQQYLLRKCGIVCLLADDFIESSDTILDQEKAIIREEKFDAIMIFPNSPGSQIEFLDFAREQDFKGKLLLCIKEEFFPYGESDGVLTSKIKEYSLKGHCHLFRVKKDKDLRELSYEVLTDYFRYN